MKKIGSVIIMHDGQNNYGTSLQGFANVKVFELFGWQFEIIRYRRERSICFTIKTLIPYAMSGGVQLYLWNRKNVIDKQKYPQYGRQVAARTAVVDVFKQKYFEPITRYYHGWKDLCEGSKNYGVCMVGSDQVWGPLSLYSGFYNLRFVDERVAKFSYASSFGVAHILPWQKRGVASFLNRLDRIGVRELQGKQIVETLSCKTATVVLDPTFLLTEQQWNSYLDNSRHNMREPYILCYVLGKRKVIREEIQKLRATTGLKVVFMRHIDEYIEMDEEMGDFAPYDIDPLDFVKLVRDAAFVVTDSLHGSVFSIIFKKKFVAFYRHEPGNKKSTNSRIDNLLAMFGLKERIFRSNLSTEMLADIDYESVTPILERLRQESIVFLKGCVGLRKE